MISPARPPSLRLIRGALADTAGWAPFAGHGAPSAGAEPASELTGGYARYAMGMPRDTVPGAVRGHDDAFLVIDSLLRVQVVSEQAARLLGVTEEDALEKPVSRFLGPADAEAREPEDFLHLLRRASLDGEEGSPVFVRPHGAFGVRLVARIAPCGPPGNAVVLLRTRAVQVEIKHRRRR